MRFNRRLICCFLTRRRGSCCCTLTFFVFLIGLMSILHMLITVYNENNSSFHKIFSKTTQVKDDIIMLNNGQDIEFYGDEISQSDLIDNKLTITYKPLLTEKMVIRRKLGKKIDMTILTSSERETKMKADSYLFLLGHYEQLGKTTINYLQAAMLASHLNRSIVEPFVRNSRFCGLQAGWIGEMRKKSREFLPMDNYFEMPSLDNLFSKLFLPGIISFKKFQSHCTSVTMVYFLYADNQVENKRYLQLSDRKYSDIENSMKKNNGYVDCTFVEHQISTNSRLYGLSINKGICVDPEILVNTEELDYLTKHDKCISIFLWRGHGYHRTHFNISLPKPHEYYISQIKFSKLLLNDVSHFINSVLKENRYIGIHIRAERQLLWYTVKRYEECINMVENVVKIIMRKKGIKQVFISSDIGKHGSDQMKALNSSILEKAKDVFEKKLKSIGIISYNPDKSRGLIFNDAGFVALTELQILSQSTHLVTLGAGTFQSWIVQVFKNDKAYSKTAWSLTRVCSNEYKNNRNKKMY